MPDKYIAVEVTVLMEREDGSTYMQTLLHRTCPEGFKDSDLQLIYERPVKPQYDKEGSPYPNGFIQNGPFKFKLEFLDHENEGKRLPA